jgi:hypothetical protein
MTIFVIDKPEIAQDVFASPRRHAAVDDEPVPVT